MALVTMYDSVTAGNIPRTAQAVAGYVDGHYAWTPTDWGLFPSAVHIAITVFGASGVKVCDCETGDLTPQQAAAWAAGEVQAGRRPTIYCNTSTMPAVRSALAPFGLSLGNQVDWWQAQYDGVLTLAPVDGVTPVAKQYADPGPVDLSVADPRWLGLDPPAPTTPPGASSMAKVSIAERPNIAGIGPGVDIVSIGTDGTVSWRANTPLASNLGDKVPISPQPVAADDVAHAWRADGSAMDVFVTVVNADLKTGSLYVNAMEPANDWSFGSWVLVDPAVELSN